MTNIIALTVIVFFFRDPSKRNVDPTSNGEFLLFFSEETFAFRALRINIRVAAAEAELHYEGVFFSLGKLVKETKLDSHYFSGTKLLQAPFSWPLVALILFERMITNVTGSTISAYVFPIFHKPSSRIISGYPGRS